MSDTDPLGALFDFLRTSPDAFAAYGPQGELLFKNEVMARLAAEPALGGFLRSDQGRKVLEGGLRRTRYVPFGYSDGTNHRRAKIKRLLARDDTPIALVRLVESDQMAALTALRRKDLTSSDQDFRRRAAAERFEAFFIYAQDGIGVLNGQGRLISANPTLCRLLGARDETALSGAHFDELFKTPNAPGSVFIRDGHEMRLAEEARKPFDTLLASADGPLPIEISLTERRRLRRWEFFVVVRDLTDARRLKEVAELNDRLVAAQRVRDDFIQLISHEMRAPLAAIVSAAENLRSAARLTPGATRHSRVVEDSARDALTQFSSILSLTSGSERSADHSLVPADLIAQLRRQYDPVAERLRVTLRVETFDAGRKPVRVDARRVFLIMTNLVSNALKHTPPGGEVRPWIKVDETAGRLEMGVGDTGTGIPKDRQKDIFDAFETGAEQMDINAGLGVGLALVKGAVRDLGGQITLRSTPGQGTDFSVRLPLGPRKVGTGTGSETVPTTPCSSDDPPAPLSLPSGTGVLIVDDDPVNRTIMAVRLRDLDLRPVEAASGETALDLLKTGTAGQIGLIFMDRCMEGLDGIATARAIGALDLPHPARIWGLTAHLDDKLSREMRSAGMERVLEKPLNAGALARLIVVTPGPGGPGHALSEDRRDRARRLLSHEVPDLLHAIEAGGGAPAAQAAVRLAKALAALGAKPEAAHLRNLALRLNDGLSADAEQIARIEGLQRLVVT